MGAGAGNLGGGDALVVLLIVLVADALLAGLPGLRTLLALPLALVARAAGWFDRKLNRDERSVANRLLRGALVVCAVAVLAFTAGRLIHLAAGALPYGWMIEAAAIACLIAQRRLVDHLRAVARALADDDLAAGRAALAGMVTYETNRLDAHAVARGAIEAAAAKFCDGLIATMFWYLLTGLPGLCVTRAVNILADRIGHPSPRYVAFGLVASRLDSALSLLPALVAGAVLAAASSFVPAASPVQAFRVWLRHLGEHKALDAGRGQAAVAGALGLTLAGPRRTDGGAVGGDRVGQGRVRATARDVGRAVLLILVAWVITAGALAAMVVARGAG
jgi:adenosylcobinamide-phosphate synthase